VVDRATAIAAEHATRVCIVDVDHRSISLSKLDDFRQPCNVSVHAENAVGDYQTSARSLRFLQCRFERVHIGMAPDFSLRLGQANSVDDACMIQLIAQNRVAILDQYGNDTAVTGEPRLKDESRFGPFERREFLLQLLVHTHRAGDCPDRAGPGAKFSGCD